MTNSILARLQALENRPKGFIEIFVFEDGHRERGDLFRVIEDMTTEGADYAKRNPHEKVVDYILPGSSAEDDNLFPAIFEAVKGTIAPQQK